MSQLKIKPIDKLWAEFAVPGDKSISHRAAILSGLSNGDCRVDNFLPSEDCICTLNAMASVGVSYDVLETKEGYGPTSLLIHGRKMKLTAPSDQVDCGNSGTGMRLLAGMLAAQPFESILTGDASLCSRPMGRIITPLTEMGASIQACGESPGCAPLRIGGGKLRSIHYDMPVASAQVKSAVLLAGLFTEGKTSVTQPAETRDHTERMLEHFRVRSLIDNNKITVYGGQVPESRDVLVPGDISSAAFWIVAAAATPGAHLLIKNVGLNPTRTALLDVLIRMGAQIKDAVRSEDGGEPYGNIEITGQTLHGTEIKKEEIPNLIDEVPILAVAAALAQGKTKIRNAAELRVKESDRISCVVENLSSMGVEVEEYEDGMEIKGGHPLHSAVLDSFGDHRIAMAFAIAGLFAKGETVIKNTDCINTSYPGFADDLRSIQNGKSPS